MKQCLNLGCQIHHFDSQGDCVWVNQDIVRDDPNIRAEIHGDAADMTGIPDEAFDFIYAGHLVEHYYPDTLQKALKEWCRVLKKGGRLVIVTPDCGSAMRDYASGTLKSIEDTWQQLYGRIYHYDREEERHHIAFDWETLRKMTGATEVGKPFGALWRGAERLDFNNPPEELKPFMGNHISLGWPPHNNGYQLGIILTR